jgi:uncharacterized membrane protein
MPNLGPFHPQIVHFVVGLLFVGVAFRIVSLTGRLRFTNYAATTLLLIGASAAVLAVRSGTDAHGPVERIPGTRELVMQHERQGQTTRNFFLAVAAIELIALALARRDKTAHFVRYAYFASAIVGVFGCIGIYETAEHGGQLVYSYAGGPGLRTGDPKDVERLLLSGLYNQSREDRKAGRFAEFARLVNEMATRFPSDTTVRFLRVESLLLDSKNYPAALAGADSISIAPTDARLRSRQASLKADIYLALGKRDSARAALAPVVAAFPQNTRLKAQMDSIK